MPDQLLLCLQLSLTLDTEFKGLIEQSGKQRRSIFSCRAVAALGAFIVCWLSLRVGVLAGHMETWSCFLTLGRELSIGKESSVLLEVHVLSASVSGCCGGIHSWRTTNRPKDCFGSSPKHHSEDWHKGRPYCCRKRDNIPFVLLS